VLKNNLLL